LNGIQSIYVKHIMKQYAPACDRNQKFILEVLKEILPGKKKLLEVGSGTGQHAGYFAPHFPDLDWLPTDLEESLPSIKAWRDDHPGSNIEMPRVLDLAAEQWPIDSCDVVVCINTIHIVSWRLVEQLFNGAGKILSPGGVFYVYGPFKYADQELAESNQHFDAWLKDRDPESGIREFEKVNKLAEENNLKFKFDISMPANNRSIVWEKI
jgi:SAM-dependent methyltransferase